MEILPEDAPFPDLYETGAEIGGGTFGMVRKGRERFGLRRLVALKQIGLSKSGSMYDEEDEQDVPIAIGAFREVQSLRRLCGHPNIIELLDVRANGNGVCLVMEMADTDLYHVVESYGPLDEANVKYMIRCVLRGIAHCHANGIMHRDLKPSNVLIWFNGAVKIADFGLARTFFHGNESAGVQGQPKRQFSHQVATRWYRAPELLFGSKTYDQSIDIWAIGVMLAELILFGGAPLFPGRNDIDQIHRIIQVLGSPSKQVLENKFGRLPDAGKIVFPDTKPVQGYFGTSKLAELAQSCLKFDPDLRPTARKLLSHESLYVAPYPRFSFYFGRKNEMYNNKQGSEK